MHKCVTQRHKKIHSIVIDCRVQVLSIILITNCCNLEAWKFFSSEFWCKKDLHFQIPRIFHDCFYIKMLNSHNFFNVKLIHLFWFWEDRKITSFLLLLTTEAENDTAFSRICQFSKKTHFMPPRKAIFWIIDLHYKKKKEVVFDFSEGK